MPTAEGFIKSSSGGRFVATFTVEGLSYNFVGASSSGAPPFTCNEATLTYTAMKQLSATRIFDGKLGPNTVSITLANGPVISGTLDMPINPGSSLSGSGVWSQNLNMILPDHEI